MMGFSAGGHLAASTAAKRNAAAAAQTLAVAKETHEQELKFLESDPELERLNEKWTHTHDTYVSTHRDAQTAFASAQRIVREVTPTLMTF